MYIEICSICRDNSELVLGVAVGYYIKHAKPLALVISMLASSSYWFSKRLLSIRGLEGHLRQRERLARKHVMKHEGPPKIKVHGEGGE